MNRGIVVEIMQGSVIVMTPEGAFQKIERKINDCHIGEEIWFSSPRRRSVGSSVAIFSSMAAVIAFILVFVTLFAGGAGAKEIVAYVSIDINPSIELGIDSAEKVRSLVGLNSDGNKLLEGIRYSGRSLSEVTEALLWNAEQNVLSQGSADIIVASTVIANAGKLQDDTLSSQVKEIIMKHVSENHPDQAEDYIVAAFSTPEEVREAATEEGISSGKYAIYLNAKNNGYSISINDIKQTSIHAMAQEAGGLNELIGSNSVTRDSINELWQEEKSGGLDKKLQHLKNDNANPSEQTILLENGKDKDKDKEKEKDKGNDKEKEKNKNKGKDKDREKDKDKGKGKGNDIEKDKDKGKGKENDKEKDKDKGKGNDIEKDKDKGKGKGNDIEKDKDKGKGKGNDKEKDKDKGKENDKEKDKDKGKGNDKEKDKDKGKGNDKEKDKDKDKDNDKEKDKDKDKDNDKEKDKDKDKDNDKEKDKNQDKDKRNDKNNPIQNFPEVSSNPSSPQLPANGHDKMPWNSKGDPIGGQDHTPKEDLSERDDSHRQKPPYSSNEKRDNDNETNKSSGKDSPGSTNGAENRRDKEWRESSKADFIRGIYLPEMADQSTKS
ncbi:anti-sigma factor domain-containing protein [Paenibacillus sp. J2TS4]|uniref:anti-sigma factor domain-containing protein n=1 Tax=Paenibacillus sp. J2TS4 TaxID=2807194 RepID=UPI001B085737|nr:anti-sigma factor domain-containing protein [Paenibacillus sp. J2TS4]GIP34433.1 hypothetical protein J2TS4_36430 [Paenibacillus sp. J2TS4]